MIRSLSVFLGGELAGLYTQDHDGAQSFRYAETWLTSDHARPLSVSLPLRAEPFSERAIRGYFGGILPEAGQRQALARFFGISPRNDFALLEKIGGECAGSVSFLSEGTLPAEPTGEAWLLSDRELSDLLNSLPSRPVLAGEHGVRLSLAGAQSKLAITIRDDCQIMLPLDGSPTTHILKPASSAYPQLCENEHFCMSLARSAGLNVASTALGKVGEITILQVERFDRIRSASGIERVHQEDFCQALAIDAERKYELEGGPSLAQCFELVRKVSARPAQDLIALFNAVIFNLIVGNNDAHGKNFSILHIQKAGPVRARLTPMYDLVSTMAYPELSTRMAMRFGGEAMPGKLTKQRFGNFAIQVNLSENLVLDRARKMAIQIGELLEDELLCSIHPEVAQATHLRAQRLLEIL